jgi:hypothetical protein
MGGPAIAHTYRYRRASSLSGPALTLATSGGAEPHPYFFEGALAEPALVAQALWTLSRVVQSRYHVPSAMLQKILVLADPVVTSGADLLRFEGFSSCASVYTRLDLLPDAFASREVARPGTTNVDFNADMRAALARVRSGDPLALSVGQGEVVLAAAEGAVIERKVPLPLRWLKGFVEVQAYQAAMRPRLELRGAEAARFLRSLPRTKTGKHASWIAPSGAGIRLSQRASSDAVRVTGLERLRALEELALSARTLRVYAHDDAGTSAWVLDLGRARFVLVLSAEVWRGFSGEGQALTAVALADDAALARTHAALRWRQVLRAAELAAELGEPADQVARALATLGARGLVGYDLDTGAYYHRELPFELAEVEALQPRLIAARALVAARQVVLHPSSPDGLVEADVQGSDVTHRVRLGEAVPRCTCPWFAKHQGDRGPCKHVLAAQLALEASEGDE